MNSKPEITAEEIVEKLTQEAPQVVKVSYDGYTVKGKLDLRHRIIQVAVTLTNCTFTDEVDLGYCEFKQCVDFSRSRFEKDLNSRWTIYRKALLFEEAIFEGGAVFAEVDCEGIGYFGGALFKNRNKEISFISAKFNELLCQGEFLFRIDLRAKSDSGSNDILTDVRQEFESRQIVLSQIKKEGEIWVMTDANSMTYTARRHAGALSIYRYRRTIFKGGADFNNLQCKGNGLFDNILFDNPDKEINFIDARFNVLECNGAIFIGGATFNSLQCEDGGSFKNTRFGNREIDFCHARFGVLDCSEATFSSGADFNSLRCESGYFKNAQFENAQKEISFVCTRFGSSLEFQGATFTGKVDFRNAEVTGTAILWGTTFQNSVTLNCATINNLSIRDPKDNYGADSLPFKKKDVDLRRCKFSIFEGTEKQQRDLVKAQSPEKFSMDPYLQFEKYYRSIGDESCAKKVYHDGRVALRKNAMRRYYYFWSKKKRQERNPEIHWSPGKMITDLGLRWMIGYGVRMWLPLLWILFFLCVGTYAFWPAEAMSPKKDIEHTDNAVLSKLGHRLWYSVDLFIPIVNLRIADEYKRPHGGLRAAYAVLHIGMGWLLVPLLIASLSGVIKKNERSP